jgi:1,4-alpha-glucan branching enzyme
MQTTISQEDLARIVHAYHHDPFQVLGAHVVAANGQERVSVRAFLPFAEQAWVALPAGQRVLFERLPGTDLFEAQLPAAVQPAAFFGDGGAARAYEILTLDKDGVERCGRDPYSFLPVLSELDLQLFNEGTHYCTYDKLGGHLMEHQSVRGVLFAVWAPNATRVSVTGDFNRWDGRCHPMRIRGSSGIWEVFIPGLPEGTLYKYEVKTRHNALLQKTDPQGFYAEMRPKTASVVWDIDKHQWGDNEWMAARRKRDALKAPMAIYEVHLGSWMRVPETNGYLSYRDLADRLAPYVKQEGYTHIELLPLTEHPLDASWGYQVTGYFAPTSRFGAPDDFQYFIDTMHRHGIGVIMDWVPAHFPKNDYGLAEFDGTALYEYADTRIGEHKEWGTKVFNWARTEVQQFLLNSALFWLDRYHIDGLRVDAVASMLYRDYGRTEWVPNQFGGRENLEAIAFLQRMNERCHVDFPGTFTCAEESTAFPAVSRPVYLGGLGFTFKWNMGWMHDTLDYIAFDPVYRKYHHNKTTFGLMYAFSENFILPISHDEVVHLKRSMLDKMPGDVWQKFANLRLYYGFMWTHPGKKLLFMGQDFGQWKEWNEDHSLDWHLAELEPHAKLLKWMADLNQAYTSEPSLYELDYEWKGFEWIDPNDWENSVLSYIRRAADSADHLVIVCNFTPVVRHNYRLGVPHLGTYREVLNSDSAYYYGSNVGNAGLLQAQPAQWHNQPFSLTMTLPPLGIVVLKPEAGELRQGEGS